MCCGFFVHRTERSLQQNLFDVLLLTEIVGQLMFVRLMQFFVIDEMGWETLERT